jgi:hypothetical protein
MSSGIPARSHPFPLLEPNPARGTSKVRPGIASTTLLHSGTVQSPGNSWCRWKQWDAKPGTRVHSPPVARAVADVCLPNNAGPRAQGGTHDTEQSSVETGTLHTFPLHTTLGVGLRRLPPTPTPVFEFHCAGPQCGYLARVVCATGAVASSPFLFDGEGPRPVSAR